METMSNITNPDDFMPSAIIGFNALRMPAAEQALHANKDWADFPPGEVALYSYVTTSHLHFFTLEECEDGTSWSRPSIFADVDFLCAFIGETRKDNPQWKCRVTFITGSGFKEGQLGLQATTLSQIVSIHRHPSSYGEIYGHAFITTTGNTILDLTVDDQLMPEGTIEQGKIIYAAE
jgi:hypothetical protein